jgi:myo-inositol-1(or 4)-monophosphatase
LRAVEESRDTAIGELLARSVRAAGQMALAKFRTPFKSWLKDATSPVSEVDLAVDEFLRTELAAAVPSCAWLSEEAADDRARCDLERVWIVDPIDGTRAFIGGLPDWTVVAALVENGRPIHAAVYAPVADHLYTAAAGTGAFLNGKPINASAGSSLNGIGVAGPARRLDALAHHLPSLRRLPRVHSLALRLARVAGGEIDVALVGPSSHDWDLAAADLLVTEAGGRLTTFDGKSLTYNRPDPVHDALVASGADRHAMLIAALHASPPVA